MADDESDADPSMFKSEEDVEQEAREERDLARHARDTRAARERHSNMLDTLNMEDVKTEPDSLSPKTADPSFSRLERWMTQKNCYHYNLYEVLVEYDIRDPSTIEKTISPQLLRRIVEEATEEFAYTDGITEAVHVFKRLWRKRIERASTKSPTKSRGAPRSNSRRSPSASPRGASRVNRNAPPVSEGKGLELRRWLKSKNVWQIELWEILVEKGYATGDDIADLTRPHFDVLMRETRLQYNSQVQSSMQRNRFEKNLEKFVKLYRHIGKKAMVLSAGATSGASTIHSAERRQNLPSAPELKNYLRREGIWNVDLFKELVEAGITTHEQLLETPEDVLEGCEHRVRVAKIDEMRSTVMRERLDKVLTKFRMHWRRNNYVDE